MEKYFMPSEHYQYRFGHVLSIDQDLHIFILRSSLSPISDFLYCVCLLTIYVVTAAQLFDLIHKTDQFNCQQRCSTPHIFLVKFGRAAYVHVPHWGKWLEQLRSSGRTHWHMKNAYLLLFFNTICHRSELWSTTVPCVVVVSYSLASKV